jgi:hypothetical protein
MSSLYSSLPWIFFKLEKFPKTIDSLSKFGDAEIFKIHITFLDEVNSMIEYLITCPTLNRRRVSTYQFLIAVLKNCHQIVAVDADISDLTHKFLQQTNRTFI